MNKLCFLCVVAGLSIVFFSTLILQYYNNSYGIIALLLFVCIGLLPRNVPDRWSYTLSLCSLVILLIGSISDMIGFRVVKDNEACRIVHTFYPIANRIYSKGETVDTLHLISGYIYVPGRKNLKEHCDIYVLRNSDGFSTAFTWNRILLLHKKILKIDKVGDVNVISYSENRICKTIDLYGNDVGSNYRPHLTMAMPEPLN